MATMIYSTVPSNDGEIQTFNALKDGPDDWVVFYSAKVPQERSTRPREIDFLILADASVICLEVKGGIFSRRDNEWKNGDGESVDDPIEQARSAMFALKKYAVPELSRMLPEAFVDFVANRQRASIIENDIRFEYALLLTHPNMAGVIDPPKRRDGWLLLEADHVQQPRRMYHAVAKFAQEQLPSGLKRRLGNPEYQSNLGDIRGLFQRLLTPADFDGTLVRVNKAGLRRINEQLVRLTDQQDRVFRSPLNNDRVLVDGAAGTGKTILALELARRRANAGERVLFACHSDNLCAWLQNQGLPKNATVGKLDTAPFEALYGPESPDHNRFARIAQRINQEYSDVAHRMFAGDDHPPELEKRLTDYQTAWKEWAEEVIDVFKKSGRGPPFDYLIVDEVQRFPYRWVMDIAGSSLIGGLTGGRWTMLGDFTNQGFGAGLLGTPDLREELVGWYPGIVWTKDRLTINCRNAQPISRVIARLAIPESYEENPHFQVVGQEVAVEYWEDDEESFQVLDRVVSELRERNVPAKDVVAMMTSGRSIFSHGRTEFGGWRTNDISSDYRKLSPSDLNYSWFTEFQGLECDVGIVVVGPVIIDGSDELTRRMLYTAMSRVKSCLIVIAHVSNLPILEGLF